MKTKKVLSLMLALLMALSLGITAFADGDGNWVSIPCSPDGLADGECYLDWTPYWTYIAQNEDPPLPAGYAQAMTDIYNSGAWFIDYDVPALKGTITIPAEMTGTGEAETEEISADSLLHAVINEVGAQWLPVSKTTAGLSDGDWYIDLSGDRSTIALTPEEITSLAHTVDDHLLYIDPDSRYLKYKVVFNGELGNWYDVYYLPLIPQTLKYWDGTLDLLDVFPIVQFEDEYNWTPIPTSPEGLENGEYYLDFTYDWNAWSPNVRQARLEMWNSGEWYVNHTKRMVKGSFTVPAEQSDTGTSFVKEYNPYTQDSYGLYSNALMRVGDWVKIPTSPDGLSAGDFYMDVPALAAVLGMNESDLNGVDYYGDAISGDIYLTFDGYYRMYLGDDPAVHNCMIEIPDTGTPADPDAPDQPDVPDEPETPEQSEQTPSIWKRIVSFFLRIVDFFKKLFK